MQRKRRLAAVRKHDSRRDVERGTMRHLVDAGRDTKRWNYVPVADGGRTGQAKALAQVSCSESPARRSLPVSVPGTRVLVAKR